MLECSTWCWENRVERTDIRRVCGSWEVTGMQAGYCIKRLTLYCRKQKGKRTENFWHKTHSKPELVWKPWERRTVISVSDWLDDIKSYRVCAEICSIHIMCQSGVHIITWPSWLSVISFYYKCPKMSIPTSFPLLSKPLLYISIASSVVYTSPTYSICTKSNKHNFIKLAQFMSLNLK